MNCTDTQELIPLYVGRDLDEPEAFALAEHLETCPDCSRLGDEYTGTFRLAAEFTPPQFSDFVYSGIRRRVIDEIERQNTQARFADKLAALIGSYARIASAAAAILALGFGAFYYFAGFNNKRFVESVSEPSEQTVSPTAVIEAKDPGITSDVARPVIPPQGPVQKNLADRGTKVTTKLAHLAVARHRQPRGRSTIRNLYAGNMNLAHPTPPAVEPMRMEIHTSDPNIRIIWFANAAPKLNVRN